MHRHILLAAAAAFSCGADCGNKILPRDCRLTLLQLRQISRVGYGGSDLITLAYSPLGFSSSFR